METKNKGPSRKRFLCDAPRKPNCGLVVLCSGEEGAVYFTLVVFSLCHFKAEPSSWQSIRWLKAAPGTQALFAFIHPQCPVPSFSFSVNFNSVFISSKRFPDGEGALSPRGYGCWGETKSLSSCHRITDAPGVSFMLSLCEWLWGNPVGHKANTRGWRAVWLHK